MVEYSVQSYNPNNMQKNYGYNCPLYRSAHMQQYQKPLYDFDTLKYNFNYQPDIVSFSANSQTKPKQSERELSTGTKVAIGTGIVLALAVVADLLFCKGKHVRSIFGKIKNKGESIVPDAGLQKTSRSTVSPTTNIPSRATEVNGGNTTSSTGHKIVFGKVINPYTGHRYNLYNRTPEDLKKECDAFKSATGAELHVPSTMASDLFGSACIVLERAAKDGNFPKDIKHVLVGHGYGSSVKGDWTIINGGGNVFSYINGNPNIKEGEKVLVLCCETYGTVRGRNGIGKSVILSLSDYCHPAKIVVKGENKVAGELYFPGLFEFDTKPSVYMYSDKPPFKIINKQ